ncbi:hypothetical protein U9M48_028791 [Paspalum notatum var. saurae]|uniref:Uncharacterized protein n=1 Tax=Paspalum notatum var. saurae TaxID=547442 RepID=A0AAQ3X1D7_PASNO
MGIILSQDGIHDHISLSLGKLATALPNTNPGNLPGQPEAPPKEHINAVTTRGGKSTQDPSPPSRAGKEQEKTAEPEDKVAEENMPGKEKSSKHLPHEFYDTTVLPFPPRNKKAAVDEQYSKFVDEHTPARCCAGTDIRKVIERYPQQQETPTVNGSCAFDRRV